MSISVTQTHFFDTILTFFASNNESEKAKLRGAMERCIDIYSQGSLTTTISNYAWGVLSLSQWDKTKAELLLPARQVIANHFMTYDAESESVKKANAFSEFLLRYLVTQECILRNRSYRMINEEDWERDEMGDLSIQEIVERAIYFDGKNLPRHTQGDIKQLIKVEQYEIMSQVVSMREGLQTVSLAWLENLLAFPGFEGKIRAEIQLFLDECERECEESQVSLQKLYQMRKMKIAYSAVKHHLSPIFDKTLKKEETVVAFMLHFAAFRLRYWYLKMEHLSSYVEDRLDPFLSGERLYRQTNDFEEVGQMLVSLKNCLQRFQWIHSNINFFYAKTKDEQILDVKEIYQKFSDAEELDRRVRTGVKEKIPSPQDSILVSSIDQDAFERFKEIYAQDR